MPSTDYSSDLDAVPDQIVPESESKNSYLLVDLVKKGIKNSQSAVKLVENIFKRGLLKGVFLSSPYHQIADGPLSVVTRAMVTDREKRLRLASAISRVQMAEQLRNKYLIRKGQEDPIAHLLEENALESSLLVISVKRSDDRGYQVGVVKDFEKEEVISNLFGSERINEIVESAKRHDGREEWPAGMKHLHKKVNHAASPSRSSDDRKSEFIKYQNIRFANSNIPLALDYAINLIQEVMANPATVIVMDHRIEIVNPFGAGIKITNPSGPDGETAKFVAFVDSAFHTKPRYLKNTQQKSEVA